MLTHQLDQLDYCQLINKSLSFSAVHLLPHSSLWKKGNKEQRKKEIVQFSLSSESALLRKTCYVVSRIKFALLRKSSGGTANAINLIIHSFSGFVSRSGLKKNSADLSEAATQLKEERSITLIKPILYPQFWESVKTPMIVNDQTCWTVPKKSLQVHRYLMLYLMATKTGTTPTVSEILD